MLSKARIVLQGQSAYAHEQEAIAFLREVLPDQNPYQVWELVELLEPSSGRLLEIDAIVLGYSALYVVEIKSGPGVYAGDTVDWYRTPPGEPARFMDPPLRLTNFKSKVLASLIQSKLRGDVRCPWVQPLVFLSHENVELRFRNYGDQSLVTRKNLLDALKNHRFPGADERARTRVNEPQMRAVPRRWMLLASGPARASRASASMSSAASSRKARATRTETRSTPRIRASSAAHGFTSYPSKPAWSGGNSCAARQIAKRVCSRTSRSILRYSGCATTLRTRRSAPRCSSTHSTACPWTRFCVATPN